MINNNDFYYNDGFKEEIVKMIFEKKHSISSLAQYFGISRSTIYRWISSYQNNTLYRDNKKSRDEDRQLNQGIKIRQLKRHIEILEEEKNILYHAYSNLNNSLDSTCEFIDSFQVKYSLDILCKTLDVKPKYYYAWSKNRRNANAKTNSDVADDYKIRFRSTNRIRAYGGSLG